MATQPNGEEDEQATGAPALSFRAKVEEQYRKIKEDAETYPYVWASYIVVYGGFSLWSIYRWRKLRKTEDRVRVLQARLHKIVEAEESTNSSTSVKKAPPSADKPPR